MHASKISAAQELLAELQKHDPIDTTAQSKLINQKMQEARATLSAEFGTATFNSPVTFGDNSPANNIQVDELLLSLLSCLRFITPNFAFG